MRRSVVRGLLGGTVGGALFALAACSGLGSFPGELGAANQSVRILAYNIRHGAGIDGVLDLERTASVINRLRPDIVTLQEVDEGVERTGRVDQARRLGDLTGLRPVFGDFMAYQGGHYGMAVLTRFDVVASRNIRLPPGAEPRSALSVRVRLPDGRELVVVGIHLYRTEQERFAQAQRIRASFRDPPVPVILAGDFNSRPESSVMELIGRDWVVPEKVGGRLTFPADEPAREIDYIVYRPAEAFDVVESLVVDEGAASDHRPVLMTLRLRSERHSGRDRQ